LKQAREILQLLMSRERLKRDRTELASDIIVAQVRFRAISVGELVSPVLPDIELDCRRWSLWIWSTR
jgi:hypothetical protein